MDTINPTNICTNFRVDSGGFIMIFRTNSAMPKTRNMPMKMIAKKDQSFKDLIKSIVEVIKNPPGSAGGFL
jgi:hypothetical protein